MVTEKYFGIDSELVWRLIKATEKRANEKSGGNGFQNTKTFLFDEYAVLKMQNINVRNVETQDTDLKHLERLAETLLDLQTQGVHVVPILAFLSDDGNGCIIQPRAKGTELYDRDKINDKAYVLGRVELLSNVPQKHFDKFVADTIKITDAGIIVDFIGKDNFFYHEAIGFQFIDLNAHYDYVYGLNGAKPDGKQITAYGCFLPCYFDTVPKYRDSVSKILPELSDMESAFLREHNRNIFKRCRTALINNGIAAEMIDVVISDERFIPQKHQLKLL